MNKKLIALASLVVLVAGCSMEEPEHPVVIEQKEITISAYRVEEPDTKTQRDESNGAVLWSPGDAISLFYGSGDNGGNRFISNASEPATVTNFTGTIGVITGGADVSVDDTYFWGLYPYDPNAICNGTSVITTLPNEQTATPGTFASNLFPSLGRAQGLSMGFYNICGGVRFSVTKEGIKSVTLRSIGGEKLTGKARIGFEGGVPVVQEILEGSDMIILTAPAGKYLEVGKFYYFITFPQALSAGIELKFESFLEEGTYERRTSSLTIKRSTFGTLRNVDQNVTFSAKTGNIPIEDQAFKTYLTANYDSNGDGEISFEEASAIAEIHMSPSNEFNLQSLRGIEYMPNLEVIDCWGDWYDSGNKSTGIDKQFYYVGPYKESFDTAWGPIGTLHYIDVSGNPKLKTLTLTNNSALGAYMGTIDVSANSELKELRIGMTALNYPDISRNTSLEVVDMGHLLGTVPDMSALTAVKRLNLDFPQDLNMNKQSVERIHLDVSNMSDLEYLNVNDRIGLISDLSANPKLIDLQIAYNGIQSLDLSSLHNLEVLNCTQASLTNLNLSSNDKLRELYCGWITSLTSLDLSVCPNLTMLDVTEDTQLSSLILPNKLKIIRGRNCNLGAINVSGLSDLEELSIANTGLTSLDVTNNPKLIYLAINDNNIGSIDLSENPLLEELACWNCGLTELDLTHNLKLTWVRCWGNLIKTLDVSKNQLLGTRSAQSKNDNGLWCVQQTDAQGHNYLQTLFIAEGQQIPYVTVNRSAEAIPAETTITVSPSNGGSEGTGNNEW